MADAIYYVLVGGLVTVHLTIMTVALITLNKKGCQNLTLIYWTLIIIFVQTIGPILYLTIGRKTKIKEYGDEYD